MAWTKAVTLVADDHAPEDVYAMARAQLDKRELVDRTPANVEISSWNSLDFGFRSTFMPLLAEVAAASQPMEVPT